MAMSLPHGKSGQALAAAITIVFFAALWVGAAAPILNWYGDRQDRLDRQLALGQRMAILADTIPQLRREAGRVGPMNPAEGRDALLDGTSDALAAAALGAMVQDMALAAGARITSSEALPAEPAGQRRAVSVRVTTNATWPVLTRLLQTIARSEKPLLVDNIQLRGPPREASDEDARIDAAFSIIGYRDAADLKAAAR
jgi:hypothetical protein